MEELANKIKLDKEVLDVFPQNNYKNIEKYKQKLESVKSEYSEYKNEIKQEITTRFNKIVFNETNPEIEKLQKQKCDIEKNLVLLNNIMTSYEKMGLDKCILKLRRFYKENLDVINTEILKILRKFNEVGIKLCLDDFQNEYVKQYLQDFFETKDVLESDTIKTKFEEIYWKFPELITCIRLNFEQIYLKNEKQIDKYFLNEKKLYLNRKNKTEKEIVKEYIILNKQMIELMNCDTKSIINNFKNGVLKIQDYKDDVVLNNYLKFVSKDLLDICDDNLKQEIDVNLVKLSHTLYEYQKYLEFKFIIDKVNKLIEENEKSKGLVKNTLKQIKQKESKINNVYKNLNRTGLIKISEKAKEKLEDEYSKLIAELDNLYKELNRNIIIETIVKRVNKSTTILDGLQIANSFYEYVTDCRYEKDEDEITKEQLDDCANELSEFMNWPYFTILNNVRIQEENGMTRIIHDIYKLLQININEEELSEDSIENLIHSIEIVKQNYYMKKANINKEEITDMIEFKKILEK